MYVLKDLSELQFAVVLNVVERECNGNHPYLPTRSTLSRSRPLVPPNARINSVSGTFPVRTDPVRNYLCYKDSDPRYKTTIKVRLPPPLTTSSSKTSSSTNSSSTDLVLYKLVNFSHKITLSRPTRYIRPPIHAPLHLVLNTCPRLQRHLPHKLTTSRSQRYACGIPCCWICHSVYWKLFLGLRGCGVWHSSFFAGTRYLLYLHHGERF